MGNRRGGKGRKKKSDIITNDSATAASVRSTSVTSGGAAAAVAASAAAGPTDSLADTSAAESVAVEDYTSEPRPTMLATVVVNLRAVYNVELRDVDDFAASGEIEGDLLSFAVPPPSKFNGRYELRFMFVTPTPTHCIRNFRPAHRAGRVLINGGAVRHELGPLWHEKTVESAVLLDEPPRSIQIEVFTTERPVMHPTEAILADHVLAVLEMDEYSGSVSSSHLQNQVRELPFYAAVFDKGVQPSWQAFIDAHPDKWSVVKYTKEEIERNEIGVTCRARELRVYANVHAGCFREGDVARERIRVAAEKELHEVLLERLRERPYEQSELLKELVNERSFLTLMTLNFVKIMAMYEALPEQYFVLCDALHPIAIEPRAKTLPPEHGPGGGLRYDRVRRVWVAPTERAHHERSAKPANAEPDGESSNEDRDGAASP